MKEYITKIWVINIVYWFFSPIIEIALTIRYQPKLTFKELSM